MNRQIDNAIRFAQNLHRRELVDVEIIIHHYGNYDPSLGKKLDNPESITIRNVQKERADSSEIPDSNIKSNDTKLLIRQFLLEDIEVKVESEIIVDDRKMEVIYDYIDSSNSLRILYVR